MIQQLSYRTIGRLPYLKEFLWDLYLPGGKLWFQGSKFHCPVCESDVRKFLPYGLISRDNAKCPVCMSLERHRLIWLFLQRKTDLCTASNKKMLHIAPERMLENKFSKIKNLNYLTADLYNPRVMVKMDITNIELPDNSFDIIYCSHVFEHVPNDRLAMRELHRVLKPDGWAVLIVPITAEVTVEDPSITDPRKREKLFGQHDHVRRYGPDYVDRLINAGFAVAEFTADDIAMPSEQENMVLNDGQKIYYCTK
jgi:hypothetical protein